MLENKTILKLFSSLLLFTLAGFLYGLSIKTQEATTGYQSAHLDRVDDTSVVSIVNGADILNESQLSSINGPIVNAIYGKHYDRTGKLERQAIYTSDLKKTGDSTYEFSIQFLPSKTTYPVSLTVTSVEEKKFTVEIQ